VKETLFICRYQSLTSTNIWSSESANLLDLYHISGSYRWNTCWFLHYSAV